MKIKQAKSFGCKQNFFFVNNLIWCWRQRRRNLNMACGKQVENLQELTVNIARGDKMIRKNYWWLALMETCGFLRCRVSKPEKKFQKFLVNPSIFLRTSQDFTSEIYGSLVKKFGTADFRCQKPTFKQNIWWVIKLYKYFVVFNWKISVIISLVIGSVSIKCQ